jgi:multiple sugar transport system ATP-binding protein
MMDEPLGALDAEFRHTMCGELRALHDRLRATTVYVTHDQSEAMAMADTIAVMNHGVIEQLAPPQQIYDRPASMYVAEFIGSPSMNLLPCVRDAAGRLLIGGAALDLAPAPADSGDLVLGVRPEHVRLGAAEGPVPRARVYGVEYLGTTQIVALTLPDGTQIKARTAASVAARVGDAFGLHLAADRIALFCKSDGRALRWGTELG